MSFANIYKCYAKTLKSKASPSLFVYDRQHLIVCSLLFPPHIVTNHFISVLQLSNIFLMRNTIRRLPSVITMFTMLNHLVQKLLPENAPSTLAVRRVVWRVESRRLRWVIDHEAIWDTKLNYTPSAMRQNRSVCAVLMAREKWVTSRQSIQRTLKIF